MILPRNNLLITAALVSTVAIVAGAIFLRQMGDNGPRTARAPMAVWPWPGAVVTHPYKGVTCWTVRSGDSTRLIRFDFDENPSLRLGLYDQDEDDLQPYDDNVNYSPMGVAAATQHLNEASPSFPVGGDISGGPVVAAWNGLFFALEGHHVTPTVTNGAVRYNVGNHRWTFGVKYGSFPEGEMESTPLPPTPSPLQGKGELDSSLVPRQDSGGRPAFDVIYMPDRATLEKSFTFASGGAQCLVREGAPLLLAPFPPANAPPEPQPAPSTPAEAGHIPLVDHIKTSRVSLGWSRDSKQLYVLIVGQSGTENGSVMAFEDRGLGSSADSRARMLAQGGWDLADEQQFWLKLGVWGAINSDGGAATQFSLIRPDGSYNLMPSTWAAFAPGGVAQNGVADSIRADAAPAGSGFPSLPKGTGNDDDLMVFPAHGRPDDPPLPDGGSLMYFYVRDISKSQSPPVHQ